MSSSSSRSAWWLLPVIVIVLVGLAWYVFRPVDRWVQGQIDVTQVMAASKVAGRVGEVAVDLGDVVAAGDVLAVMELPEVEAKAQQIDAKVAAAQAQDDKARVGARDEQIRAARAQWQAAEQQAAYAEATARRVSNLFDEGVMPAQKRDEAVAGAKSARAMAEAARQQYDIAQRATRPEDLRAANALVQEAEGGRAEVDAALAERQVLAPATGEIATRVVEPGEVVGAGMPLLVVAVTSDPWLVLNLREDVLTGIRMGRELVGQVPALGGREVRFKVDRIAPMADFATWRSTRDLGGFDLRSFEVRARPVAPVEGLRAGMSVLLSERALREGG